MGTESKVGRIRHYERRNVNSADPANFPNGPNAGFLSTEWIEATLRIQPSNAATEYDIEIYTFENGAGNDWIEDPIERRTIPAGQPYTRSFRARTIDSFACKVTRIAGAGAKVDIFWTMA